jgi:SAM-dependent methyltransferase
VPGAIEYHECEWTPEQVQRFWDGYAAHGGREDTYFSKMHGPAILDLARRYGGLSDPVIDVGCGNGALLDALLSEGFACTGIDSSAVSVRHVTERFRARSGFHGAMTGSVDRLPLPDGQAGTALLVEVVEHLDGPTLERALAELHRVLRPGGHAIVTVPNQEDLQAAMVACPECGCTFHRMQHVRSLSPASLSAVLRAAHFKVVTVVETDFANWGRQGAARVVALARRMVDRWRRRAMPHLVAIAQRPER